MKTALPLAVLAALALSACNSESGAAPAANETAANETAAPAAPITLPPAVKASKTFRCADKSVVYVDFLDDDKTVNVREKSDAVPVKLTASEPGKPFTAEGYSLTGDTARIDLTLPGKKAQVCKS